MLTLIAFSTTAEGPLQNGWETWFSDSQTNWNSFTGEEAEGASLHITELDGASLYMQFQGGNARSCDSAFGTILTVHRDSYISIWNFKLYI